MRQTPTHAVIPPTILSQNFLQSISPSQSASPSVAHYSAGLAHDARNMLAAMDIYCELLSSPGVLKAGDQHLLEELRLLRDSSGKLLDRLLIEALKCLASSDQTHSAGHLSGHLAGHLASHASGSLAQAGAPMPNVQSRPHPPSTLPSLLYDPADIDSARHIPDQRERPAIFAGAVVSGSEVEQDAFDQPDGFHQAPAYEPAAPLATIGSTVLAHTPGRRVTNLAAELQATLPMLSALAGPRVHVSLAVGSCPAGELVMPPVDLTRVLINLVRNAAEAMSIGGRILIGVEETSNASPAAVLLSIEDNGPGIPLSLLDRIFDLQVSTATPEESGRPRMQFRPRGLGLRIVRDFVEASGGSVRALRLPDRGSRFELVLPMVTVEVTKGRSQM